MAAVHALYDMCANPEYIKELRAEAQEALLSDGGSWKLGTVRKLRKLDSFLKESLRFNQPDARKSPWSRSATKLTIRKWVLIE